LLLHSRAAADYLGVLIEDLARERSSQAMTDNTAPSGRRHHHRRKSMSTRIHEYRGCRFESEGGGWYRIYDRQGRIIGSECSRKFARVRIDEDIAAKVANDDPQHEETPHRPDAGNP
jgi:hypothetical protein